MDRKSSAEGATLFCTAHLALIDIALVYPRPHGQAYTLPVLQT
jgi:hypothetical protein